MARDSNVVPERALTETPYFFQGRAGRLFGLHHRSARTGVPFLFCHPFVEEKLWAHRVYVTFARQLAALGHDVLRFDYSGNGDSEGLFVDSTVASAAADIDTAIDELKRLTGAPQVALLGLRFGASLAAAAAARRQDVERVVLWSPILSGAAYLQELLRINVTTQMAVYREVRDDREALGQVLAAGGVVNVDGYEVNGVMAKQLSAFVLADLTVTLAARTLVVHVDRAPAPRVPADVQRLVQSWPNARLEAVQEDPFWKEIAAFYDRAPLLFARTLNWIQN